MNKNRLHISRNSLLTNFTSYFERSEIKSTGQIILGLKALPTLVDHGFQDMVVLPGAFYIEMAASIYTEKTGRIPEIFTNINFNNLVILSDQESIIEFKCDQDSKRNIIFKFNEKSIDHLNETTLSIESKNSESAIENNLEVSIDEFTRLSTLNILSTDFYSGLKSNANQYGPTFRNIKEIWKYDNMALCSFDFSKVTHLDEKFIINPFKLDAFTQLLSVLDDSKGQTFILKSIDKIQINDPDLSGNILCLAKATTRDTNGNGFTGNLTIFDQVSGKILIQYTNVHITYLEDTKSVSAKSVENQRNICISATFTSEPVEQSILFWSKYFENEFKVEFAPYNQVFQELLTPSSLLGTNKMGVNCILLNLEDWANYNNAIPQKAEKVDNLFQNKASYILPNNLKIAHLNKYETEYVYKEIFVDKCYMRHGININDGDTVIDIGANIGLFTLFVNQFGKNINVFSFEPSPIVYDLLKTNSEAYGPNIKTFNYGVSDRKKNAVFTFYKKSSVFSSFQANETEDKEAIQTVIRNMLAEITDNDSVEEYLDEITNGRLDSELIDCQLISVADIINDNNIKKIDLLKIDAEKSELAILNGIGEDNWQKIKQIVIEVHDKSGKLLDQVKSILINKGFIIAVEEEKLLKESGLYNIYAVREENIQKSTNTGLQFKKISLGENCSNFLNTIKLFMNSSSVPMIVGICPPSPSSRENPELNTIFMDAEKRIIQDLNNIKNIHTISSSEFLAALNVENYFDEHSNELGHIPYSNLFFTSIGTSIYRRIFSINRKTYKVIALDCDNTLWKGVCGEDGPDGIKITESYKFLQQFILKQVEGGMIVCLCSKNNEEDVLEVFRNREDMLLKTDHLISWKLNWDFKSNNLKSLAKELNLGLDSFIFIDDNPIEINEVKINCPGTLVLQLPPEEEIPAFLNHSWIFDNLKETDEDKKRTQMYKENIQREKYRESSVSLKDFLAGLMLKIKISHPKPDQMARISQLTFRTNQFNFTTKRRTESEIANLIDTRNFNCIVAEVSDRFGDYGLVGVVLYTSLKDSLEVDTFLLSCRVLGRGVEHKILSELGKIAAENNLNYVAIEYIETPKNRPALKFIENIGSEYKEFSSDKLRFKFPVTFLKGLEYNPTSGFDESPEPIVVRSENKKTAGSIGNLSDKIQAIASVYNSVEKIQQDLEDHFIEESKSPIKFLAPSTNIEKQLTGIWENILGKTKIGVQDNFFDIGGSSLKAVQLIARIKKDLGINLSLVKLFESPTIQLLSSQLNPDKPEDNNESEKIMERGKRRRNIKGTRKRSDFN